MEPKAYLYQIDWYMHLCKTKGIEPDKGCEGWSQSQIRAKIAELSGEG
jgi:predicted HicB family RNase H-like nuclease